MNITLYNHDTGEYTTMSLGEFVRLFNDSRMSDEIYSIESLETQDDKKMNTTPSKRETLQDSQTLS